MEIYQTEEQQVEAIKSFWQKNGNYLITLVLVGLGAFVGNSLYQDHRLAEEVAVSKAYQDVIEKLEVNTLETQEKLTLGDKFIADNAGSGYVALTALAMAKETANVKDWEKTAQYLQAAVDASANEGIKGIAVTRLARVQVQLSQYEAALSTLATELPASFTVTVEEIKGDIYLKQDKKELARIAYQVAITADASGQNTALQMKLDNLAEATVLPTSVE